MSDPLRHALPRTSIGKCPSGSTKDLARWQPMCVAKRFICGKPPAETSIYDMTSRLSLTRTPLSLRIRISDMPNRPSRPDPYCAFKNDRERRLALADRNRRDIKIAWALLIVSAVSGGGASIGNWSALWRGLLAWFA